MSNLRKFALSLAVLIGITTSAKAATIFLATDDFVGISFWLISMGMLAATAFFFMEQANVATQWRKSVNVAGLVTGIAFINYLYMRTLWVETGDTSTADRYIDWLITVPLQIIEFYLILIAVRKVPIGIFWRLLIGSLVMSVGGYCGEVGFIQPFLGFIIGVAGWFYILYEIFSGEAGTAVAKSGNKSLVISFGALRMIVTIGWAIYPLGYVFGHLTGGIDSESIVIIYNLADFVNKIAFGVIIWTCAADNSGKR